MFNTGDWIRVKDYNSIFQYTHTFTDDDQDYIADSHMNDTFGEQGWLPEECELWKPQPEEWCWYRNEAGYMLIKYADEFNGMPGTCEPFIGELPSFLKENT